MRRGGQVTGLVSLVLIFCVLCLSIFAVLAWAAADRERALTELNLRRSAEYYAADAAAVAWRAELEGSDIPLGAEVSRAFSAGEDRTLYVTVRREDEGFRVLRWETRYTGAWNADEHIEVWSGN